MSKTLEQLQAEKQECQMKLSQARHRQQRLENRMEHIEKGERKKRTHRLCTLGGTVERFAPEVKDLTKTELCELMEQIFYLPEVRAACLRASEEHRNRAEQNKEVNTNGTVPSVGETG